MAESQVPGLRFATKEETLAAAEKKKEIKKNLKSGFRHAGSYGLAHMSPLGDALRSMTTRNRASSRLADDSW
jgi:hypothetical protein